MTQEQYIRSQALEIFRLVTSLLEDKLIPEEFVNRIEEVGWKLLDASRQKR